MIRILHLIASSRGGGATHVRELTLGLDPTRFAQQVAMPEDGGNLCPQDFEAEGISFHRVDIAVGFSLHALREIRHLAQTTDILNVHGARAAMFGRLAAASLGKERPRIVYTIHGFSLPFYRAPRRWVLRAIEGLLAPITDAVIAVSEEERRAFLAQAILPPERVGVIWNSVTVAPFREAERERDVTRAAFGLSPDAILVTTICRLYKPRDLETILSSLARLVEQDRRVQLLVVGDGPERAQIEARRDRLGLGAHVIMAGQLLNIPAILAATDIFTLTTWGWEGLPFTVLEAMAAARPVVATRAGGIPEAVVDGETGLLVPRRDVAALTNALARLASDGDLRARMGRAGRTRVELLFSRERMIELTTQIYDGLVNAHHA